MTTALLLLLGACLFGIGFLAGYALCPRVVEHVTTQASDRYVSTPRAKQSKPVPVCSVDGCDAPALRFKCHDGRWRCAEHKQA